MHVYKTQKTSIKKKKIYVTYSLTPAVYTSLLEIAIKVSSCISSRDTILI